MCGFECARMTSPRVRVGSRTSATLTPTFEGKERIKDFLPLKLSIRHASWLNSQMRSSQSSTRINSTTRSSNFRLARRAGLKITTSQPIERARHAQKIAILYTYTTHASGKKSNAKCFKLTYEKVLPKRRGVEIMTSDEHFGQLLCFMIAGRCVAHSFLYKTRATHLSNAEWN